VSVRALFHPTHTERQIHIQITGVPIGTEFILGTIYDDSTDPYEHYSVCRIDSLQLPVTITLKVFENAEHFKFTILTGRGYNILSRVGGSVNEIISLASLAL